MKHIVHVDWDTSVAQNVVPVKRWAMQTVGQVPPPVAAALFDGIPMEGLATIRAATASIPPPSPTTPFASLVASLQSRETKLWFSREVVAHYLLALQAKRFVILTGVSGTGKTQLALAVAKHFQTRFKRRQAVGLPPGAIVRELMPSTKKYWRLNIPTEIGSNLSLGGVQGATTQPVVIDFPGGTVEAQCHREYRSLGSSVYSINLPGSLRGWIEATPTGQQFIIEPLEPSKGRDRLRFRLPSEAIEQIAVTENYSVIAVRPDWTDARGLLGFQNPLTDRYSSTPFLRLMLRANAELQAAETERRTPAPFFAVLDEMNLARVEQYFADFLSSLESGEPVHLHDDPALEAGIGDEDEELPIPRNLIVPSNLFFTGTVNVDDTTYMFSPKVLDRAFVLEFNDVDLENYGTADTPDDDSELELPKWMGFESFRKISSDDWDGLLSLRAGPRLAAKLRKLHALLATENRHFGYRVANEIGRFITLAAAQGSDDDDVETALDLAIHSKVLPKLHGTQQELEPLLEKLFAFALGDSRQPAEWSGAEGVLVGPVDATPELPRTGLKVWRMLRRVRSQGFTSFIE